MKRHFFREPESERSDFIITSVLYVIVSICISCSGIEIDHGVLETITFRFSPVRSEWKGVKSDTVLIAVSVVYRGQKGGNELNEKKESCEAVIRDFGTGLEEADFTETSRYDAAHERLKVMLNGILEKGRVETVVFRSIGE
jgi:hypothetical protein